MQPLKTNNNNKSPNNRIQPVVQKGWEGLSQKSLNALSWATAKAQPAAANWIPGCGRARLGRSAPGTVAHGKLRACLQGKSAPVQRPGCREAWHKG